tara:strand:+ start:354 stop:920 length:567 start_codon:yes stop_codon:yes gene_type:complete
VTALTIRSCRTISPPLRGYKIAAKLYVRATIMKLPVILIKIITLLSLSSFSDAMTLNLQHPPEPAYAEKHAEIAINVVKNVENIELDYSPESLKVIDRIIQGFHEEGLTEEQMAETIFTFGCYAGEVFVRNRNAKWVTPEDVMPPNVANLFRFMVIQLPDGKVWNPIDKAFKELENGAEDSLEFLYAQ